MTDPIISAYMSKIGARGGKSKSPAKLKAGKKNGKLGGRPVNPEIQRIMKERGVSRQRAYKILQGL